MRKLQINVDPKIQVKIEVNWSGIMNPQAREAVEEVQKRNIRFDKLRANHGVIQVG